MKKEPLIGLYPLSDCVLVELKQSRKNFTTKEGKYDTRTEGVVIRVPEYKTTGTMTGSVGIPMSTPKVTTKDLLGKVVHFEEFKEGGRIKRDGKIYSFIKIEDIRGYEDNEQTD